MALTWQKAIPQEDRERIIRKIQEIESAEFSSLDEIEEASDAYGAFSYIFFVGDYVLKYTDFWDHDELDFEGAELAYEGYTLEPFNMMLQSDEEILFKVGHAKSCVDLIGYSGNWVILEKINARSVQDIRLLDDSEYQLNDQQINELISFVQLCLEQGIVPVDINEGSVFPIDEETIKIIDFNLYQTMDYIQSMGAAFNPEKLPYEQVAKAIVHSSRLLKVKKSC